MTSTQPKKASPVKQLPQQTFIEKCYKNKEGKVTLGQRPNVPILVWLATSAVLLVLPTSAPLYGSLQVLAKGALFTWAWLELFYGATYLRRLFGFVVLGVLLIP